jgi:hypothetical protein
MKLDVYKTWVAGEVMAQDPAKLTDNWATAWEKTLSPMPTSGVFEHAALILAKWEFLGGLYNGARDTNAKDARAYARRFLPAYEPVHNLSGRPGVASDFFSMLRNRALHGFTPASVLIENTDEVVGWRFNDPHLAHLQTNAEGSVGVVPKQLQDDFIASVRQYAKYLDADANEPGDPPKPPKERWRCGFWMRFCPVVKTKDKDTQIQTWFDEGLGLKLFTAP